jgi:hypothetical protein
MVLIKKTKSVGQDRPTIFIKRRKANPGPETPVLNGVNYKPHIFHQEDETEYKSNKESNLVF